MKAFLKTASRVLPFLLVFSLLITGTWAATVTYPQGDARTIMEYIRNENRTTPPDMEAAGAILIDLATGKVLASKNENEKLYPASTTKIMTALLALEYGDLSEIVTVGNEANLCAYDSSKCWLDLGEEIKMADLIRGLMIHSGGDAAYVIATHIGRKIAGDTSLDFSDAIAVFVDRMNSRAQELGADSTQFKDPDGYHDPDHYTTAYNLALIAQTAMEQPFFREVVSTKQYSMPDWNQFQADNPTEKIIRIWNNTNSLILPNEPFYYEPAIGIKTGYTSEAEHCLVAAAKQDDTELLAVVLNSSKEGKWYDSVKLLEYGFDNYAMTWAVQEGDTIGELALANPADDGPRTVEIVATESKAVLAKKDTTPDIDFTIEWQTPLFVPHDTEDYGPFDVRLVAPIPADTVIGVAHYTLDGEALCDIPLTVGAEIQAYTPPASTPEAAPTQTEKEGFVHSLRGSGLWPVPALVAALVLIWVIYLLFFKPRRHKRYPTHYTSKPLVSRRRPIRRRYR